MCTRRHTRTPHTRTPHTHTDICTRVAGWRRPIGRFIFAGYFSQKSPISSGSFRKMTCNLRHPVSPRHSALRSLFVSHSFSTPVSHTYTHSLSVSLSLSASVSFSHTHSHTQSYRRDALADVAFSQALRTFEQNLYATTGSTLEESLGERRCVSIRMLRVCVCERDRARMCLSD